MANKTWEDLGGHFNWLSFYQKQAERIPENGITVELGVWLGRSICHLASLTKPSVTSYAVDLFDCEQDCKSMNDHVKAQGGSILQEFVDNAHDCGVLDKIKIIKEYSWDASKDFDDGTVDLVFIDAAHDYESVKKDIKAWLPKVKDNGVIGGHDYDASWPGVIQAVKEEIEPYYPLYTKGNHWWVLIEEKYNLDYQI